MLEKGNTPNTGSITVLPIKNSHCIICGSIFTRDRASKLYCSGRCRQAAYYHKDKIILLRQSNSPGSNTLQLNLSIKEYRKYLHFRGKIIKYKKIQSQFRQVEEGSEEWKFLYNNPNSGLTRERKAIPSKIISLNPPYLSIEQWSFIKSLYPELKPVDLIEFVCSLSSDFLDQLNSSREENSNKQTLNNYPIKNKYLQHLNKIANREVKFI